MARGGQELNLLQDWWQKVQPHSILKALERMQASLVAARKCIYIYIYIHIYGAALTSPPLPPPNGLGFRVLGF